MEAKTLSTVVLRENEVSRPASVIERPARLAVFEQLQQRHYDRIAAVYEAHYSDPCSREYRRRFIYEPMFENVELSGMNVLDAMCGSGQTTEYLRSRGAHVTGLDISSAEINSFRAYWPDCQAVCRSLFDSRLDEDSFDCVVVVGGLHHLHPHVDGAIHEIHRVLKPGGYFCFMEPHTPSIPDAVRRLWYKFDPYFSENEGAVSIAALEKEFGGRFSFGKTKYFGNIAFLLVLNSLIFRLPLRAKHMYSPALMACEAAIGKLQGKLTSCFAVAQWRKK
jgi:SAM-dependent methyltransferase